MDTKKDGHRIKEIKEISGRLPERLHRSKKEERLDRRRRRAIEYPRGYLRAYGLETKKQGY